MLPKILYEKKTKNKYSENEVKQEDSEKKHF